jgi:hypothetical protein
MSTGATHSAGPRTTPCTAPESAPAALDASDSTAHTTTVYAHRYGRNQRWFQVGRTRQLGPAQKPRNPLKYRLRKSGKLPV